jgi:Raf kinase inhibitor-like YbhB/YbcL family protein
MLHKRLILLAITTMVFLIPTTGCGSSPAASPEGETDMSIQVSSIAFTEGDTIPKDYTCDGKDISPPLNWSGVPDGTRSFVVISDDPDAPVGTWVHWVLYDIPADLGGLPEGVPKSPSVAGVGTQGSNDFRKTGYNGPCPPRGKPHRYFFKLYALDIELNLEPGATRATVEKAMGGHILSEGQVVGKYGR